MLGKHDMELEIDPPTYPRLIFEKETWSFNFTLYFGASITQCKASGEGGSNSQRERKEDCCSNEMCGLLSLSNNYIQFLFFS